MKNKLSKEYSRASQSKKRKINKLSKLYQNSVLGLGNMMSNDEVRLTQVEIEVGSFKNTKKVWRTELFLRCHLCKV